jgi:hypothetical protein
MNQLRIQKVHEWDATGDDSSTKVLVHKINNAKFRNHSKRYSRMVK